MPQLKLVSLVGILPFLAVAACAPRQVGYEAELATALGNFAGEPAYEFESHDTE